LLTAEDSQKLQKIVSDELESSALSCGAIKIFERDNSFLKCTALHTIFGAGAAVLREHMTADIIYTFVCSNRDNIIMIVKQVTPKLPDHIASKMSGMVQDYLTM
jgi:hypothetical protein